MDVKEQNTINKYFTKIHVKYTNSLYNGSFYNDEPKL